MLGTIIRRLLAGVLAPAFILACAAGAHAAPIAIGSNTLGEPTQPAVAVDAAGNAYIAWVPPSGAQLNFCKLAVGSTGCSSAALAPPPGGTFFDPPSVLVNGSDVDVFEEVLGSTNHHQSGMAMWISTDGGATFLRVPYAVGYTAVGDSMGVGPQPVLQLAGGSFGIGDVVAAGNPTFQTNPSLGAPSDYSVGAGPGPFATINPSPDYTIGNLGGEMVAQRSGSSGVLGVFQIIEAGPCPTTDGLVFTWAPLLGPGLNSNGAWSHPAGVACNAELPALTGGPAGPGMLYTNEGTSASNSVQYRRFTPPSSWGSPTTLTSGAAFDPTVSQDASGGLYATFANDNGVELAYSSDGGAHWFGPVTLVVTSGSASMNAAVGTGGQGWAVYAAGGTEYAEPFAKADAVPPGITHLSLKPRKFKPQSKGGSIVKKLKKHRGTTVSYDDSKAATTKFKVLLLEKGYRKGKGACKALKKGQKRPKHSHRCTATKSKGSFKHTDIAGANSFHFSGRVDGHTLRKGSYELEATPAIGSLIGSTVSAKFSIR